MQTPQPRRFQQKSHAYVYRWLSVLLLWVTLHPTVSPQAAPPPASTQPQPKPRTLQLPSPAAPCPTLTPGDNWFWIDKSTGPRKVRIWMRPSPARPGPLLLYWHGTASSPDQATKALGDHLSSLLDKGGLLVAPYRLSFARIFPWLLLTTKRDDDLRLSDQIVACAVKQGLVNPRKIHTFGMSAGGIQAAYLSQRRDRYIASNVIFSGGLPPKLSFAVEKQVARRAVPSLVLHGGSKDFLVLRFPRSSNRFAAWIQANGGYAIVCDHGQGHHLPLNFGPSILSFFEQHPYQARNWTPPAELPPTLPSSCKILAPDPNALERLKGPLAPSEIRRASDDLVQGVRAVVKSGRRWIQSFRPRSSPSNK